MTSPDSMRIAYDVGGTGPAVVLLHGGGRQRQDWYDAGYVDRFKNKFKVITIDLRGHGESDMPTNPQDYTTEKMGQDILAVATACGVEHFIICGMSYGGNVGRYLAAQSLRVTKLVLMSTSLGLGVSGELCQYAQEFCEHWTPIAQAQCEGTLDVKSLSHEDQNFLCRFKVPVVLAWVRALLDWPAVEPTDLPCPTLLLVGSQDQHAMANMDEYIETLEESEVGVCILPGLDHEQVFTEIDRSLDTILAFMQE